LLSLEQAYSTDSNMLGATHEACWVRGSEGAIPLLGQGKG
jgi:hypothetical protein